MTLERTVPQPILIGTPSSTSTKKAWLRKKMKKTLMRMEMEMMGPFLGMLREEAGWGRLRSGGLWLGIKTLSLSKLMNSHETWPRDSLVPRSRKLLEIYSKVVIRMPWRPRSRWGQSFTRISLIFSSTSQSLWTTNSCIRSCTSCMRNNRSNSWEFRQVPKEIKTTSK